MRSCAILLSFVFVLAVFSGTADAVLSGHSDENLCTSLIQEDSTACFLAGGVVG